MSGTVAAAVVAVTDLFLATIYTPGFLPQDDELHVFRDATSAWEYLLNERREAENSVDEPLGEEYSDTVEFLEECVNGGSERVTLGPQGVGYLHGDTPGSDSRHDLGINYLVSIWEHNSYPHEAGSLFDCALCEFTCFCESGHGATVCVHCNLVSNDESICEDGECDESSH